MSQFSLIVQIEINGVMKKAGTITGSSSADAAFRYDETYRTDKENRPVSISLPFSKTPFTPEETRAYFEGLLPEGFSRHTIADSMHIESDDYISILKELGRECLGAVQILADSSSVTDSGYKELSAAEVKTLAEEGVSQAADFVIKSHLSLTGASGKTGLYYERKTQKWFQPLGSAPSNYIVKQSHIRLESIVVNEQLCLLTAKKLGIDIPESFIFQTVRNKTGDAEILFATKRFDRSSDKESKILNGLAVPYRLHQEDFAQALGIKAAWKYEKNGEQYLKKMFEILRAYSANPIEDQLKLWRMCVFNFVIGNTDNHLKNYSLVYGKDLHTVRLAPCYDVISTRVYGAGNREMSLSINGKINSEEVTRSDFEAEAKKVGLGSKIAMRIYDEICSRFEKALYESVHDLEKTGFTEARKIADKIML